MPLGSGDAEAGSDDGDLHPETQAGCHGEGPAGLQRAVPGWRGMRNVPALSHRNIVYGMMGILWLRSCCASLALHIVSEERQYVRLGACPI